ncbi:MAG TPA: hypothetical protein VGC57_03280 [Cellulomonas sp.]
MVEVAPPGGHPAPGEPAGRVPGSHPCGERVGRSVPCGALGDERPGRGVGEQASPGAVAGDLARDGRRDRAVACECARLVVETEQRAGRDGDLRRRPPTRRTRPGPTPAGGSAEDIVDSGTILAAHQQVDQDVRPALVQAPLVQAALVPHARSLAIVRSSGNGSGCGCRCSEPVDGREGSRRGGGGQIGDEPGHRVGRRVEPHAPPDPRTAVPPLGLARVVLEQGPSHAVPDLRRGEPRGVGQHGADHGAPLGDGQVTGLVEQDVRLALVDLPCRERRGEDRDLPDPDSEAGHPTRGRPSDREPGRDLVDPLVDQPPGAPPGQQLGDLDGLTLGSPGT